MKSEIENAIETLARMAGSTEVDYTSTERMQFAQGALSLAHALSTITVTLNPRLGPA